MSYGVFRRYWPYYRAPRRLPAPGRVSATHYTLTADAGAFTETGTAADLEFGREIAADSGTFTETGTAADLEFGRRLAADAGSFTHTGTAASLLFNRKFLARSPTYCVSGQSFTQVARQTAYPVPGGEEVVINGHDYYQGNRNTFDYPPEVSWPLRVSDRGNIHRTETRYGDKGFSSDNPAQVSRSEVIGMDPMANDTDYVVSFSMLIETKELIPSGSWLSLLQLHQTADAGDVAGGPPFQMALSDTGNLDFYYRTTNEDPLVTIPSATWIGWAAATPGQWMNIYMEHRWDSNGTAGFHKVWVNGVQVVDETGIATGYNDVDGPRVQFGVYREAHDQHYAVQYANVEFASGTTLSGRLANPLPIDDAILAKGVGFAADSGAYTLTGQAATFPRTYVLGADAGSVSLAGPDVGLEFSRLISAAAGSFTLSGEAASLEFGYAVAAASGSFALGGQDVAFSRTYVLASAAATFILTGQDATLRTSGNVMPADAGAFSLAGQDASFPLGRSLVAAFGQFSLTGANASVLFSRTFAAGGATFSLSGGDVSFDTGFGLVANRGAFQVSAPSALLTYASYGSFDLDQIPVVNNIEQLRKRANVILASLQQLRPGYGPTLPAVDPSLDGRLFVRTTDMTLYQQQYGAWAAVDGTP